MAWLTRLILLLSACSFLPSSGSAQLSESGPKATLQPVRVSCWGRTCADRDAVIFVHGIYGSSSTFKSGRFDWPKAIPRSIEGRWIDVYRLTYPTLMVSWHRESAAELDEVVEATYRLLQGANGKGGLLARRPYRTIGFVAHSLGGNITAAYLHTVKTTQGHTARARHSFIITLGTPVNGAMIANVASIAKTFLLMSDPLLESLKRDNTFLRMFGRWREREAGKGRRRECRPVELYVGVEGGSVAGVTQIVSQESAQTAAEALTTEDKFRYFSDFDHLRIAAPTSRSDEPYMWVNGILAAEMKRINDWRRPLCGRGDY